MQKHWTVKIATGPHEELKEYFADQIARALNLIGIPLDPNVDVTIGREHIYVWVLAENREDAPRIITDALKLAYGTTFNLLPNFG